MYKKLYFIGVGAYVFMLMLSVLFYKERIIFLDCSFSLFHLVKEGAFCIQIYRFGDAFAQILPLLAYKVGATLDAITMSYSIGFALFYFACYVICGSLLKQYRFAVVMLLINLLFVADTFYWVVSQVPQGMSLFMLVFALVWNKQFTGLTSLRWGLIGVLLVILAFFHPLMVCVLVYTAAFFVLRNDVGIDKKVILTIVGFFALVLMIKSVFFRTEYEQHSLSGLKNFVRLFPDYFSTYANREFLKNCLAKYYCIPVFFTSVAILYAIRRQYKILSFFVGCFVGYLMLVNTMYPDADTPVFYIENLYLPLGLFLGLPVVFDLLPVLERKRIVIPLMILVMVAGCFRLYAAHDYYTSRLNWERAFLAANGDRKIIADAAKANAGILKMLWGTPYEFWQLSTIEQGRSASVIVDADPPHREWAREKTNALVVNWNVFPYRDLDPRYFKFADTTTGYIIEYPKR